MDTHTLLIAGHLLGLAFGLGGALMLDAALVRKLRGAPVGAGDVALAEHLALFVKTGLVLLWATGTGLLAQHEDGIAGALGMPKVQGKLVIVLALTLNAVVIEGLALPLVARNRGRALFAGVSPGRRAALAASGVLSAASWTAPFVLGLAREWNDVVLLADILAAWLALVLLGSLAAMLLVARPGALRRVPPRDVVGAPQRSVSLNSMRRLRAKASGVCASSIG